jgi:hypothetical protein
MHRQCSQSTLWSLRFMALHFIANLLILSVGTAYLLTGLFTLTKGYAVTGFRTLILWTISVLIFKIWCSPCTCPVCLSRMWINTGCRKHRKSKRFLGISYRLGMALNILVRRPYYCLYCGERFSSTDVMS